VGFGGLAPPVTASAGGAGTDDFRPTAQAHQDASVVGASLAHKGKKQATVEDSERSGQTKHKKRG